MTESYRPKRSTTQHLRDTFEMRQDPREVRTHTAITNSQMVRGSERDSILQPNSQSMIGPQQQKALSHRQSPLRTDQLPPQMPRSLYEEKQRSYKQQIHELQDRYESLKLKHKQALMSISHLHGKLKMFLSEDQINSDAIKIVAEETEKSYREVYETLRQRTEHFIARHQAPIRKLLEQYGCSYDESSIEGCKSQTEIIDLLVGRFTERADILRQYEAETSEKLSRSQQQYVQLQDSIKYIVQTNELYKIREVKYKEKMDEVKQDWQQVCQKLARKELESQQWQGQNAALKQRLEQLEMELAKYQTNSHEKQESDNAEIRALQNQLADMTNRVSEIHLKYQHLYAAYEQGQLAVEELTIKDKMRQGELERVSRQAVRWKERYDWLERERYQSLEIIESENHRLRDEVFRDKRESLRQQIHKPTQESEQSANREQLGHQYSLRPSNNINIEDNGSGYSGADSKPGFGRHQHYEEYGQHQQEAHAPKLEHRYKASKKYTLEPNEQYSLPSPSSNSFRKSDVEGTGLDNRMRRIEEEMSKRGIKAGPADQRLQELLKEFESKLWKMQEAPPSE